MNLREKVNNKMDAITDLTELNETVISELQKRSNLKEITMTTGILPSQLSLYRKGNIQLGVNMFKLARALGIKYEIKN